MDPAAAKQILKALYTDIDGYAISNAARSKMEYFDSSHTYGEVIPEAFGEILKKVKPKEGEVFYDLGSGTGKAVILADLLFPFSRCVGIEIIPELFYASQETLVRFDTLFRPTLPIDKQKQSCEFINGDLFQMDFSDADVVFVNSTCFYQELMIMLTRHIESSLRSGSRVITMTNPLFSPSFSLIHSDMYNFDWGKATVYCYIKN